MIKDYFKLASSNLRKRKLRSWLTLLGIFISVAVIFILISLSLGLQGAIQEQFRMLGTDKFFIMPQSMSLGAMTGNPDAFTLEDYKIVEKTSGVKRAMYMLVGNAKLEFHEENRYFMIIGIDTSALDLYTESTSIEVEDGKMLEDNEALEVLLGWDYKYNKAFSKPIEAGDKVWINGVEFKVAGILSRIGNPSDDKNIMIGAGAFKTLFNSGDRVDEIIVQVEPNANVNEVAERVKQKLMKHRGVDEKTLDFSVMTPEELLKSFNTILVIITSFLISVAAISLLVGAIGIANTMYTSVLERTREIGIMKAIGAKNSDVLSIFVIESGLLGMVGGIIGVLLGIIVTKTMEYIAINQLNTTLLRAALPWYLILGCIVFSFAIGAISGFLPARQASKVKVVDALRYE